MASTGQSVASMRRLLDGKLIPSLVAAALHACVKTEHEIHDLAVRIEREGVDEVRAMVRKLYGKPTAGDDVVPPAADEGETKQETAADGR